jgi:thiosulfate/3-mercaptopyruvate sulfurtransferase
MQWPEIIKLYRGDKMKNLFNKLSWKKLFKVSVYCWIIILSGCGVLSNYSVKNEIAYVNPHYLISPEELRNMKDAIILNCSRVDAAYIPGAVRFNLNKLLMKKNNFNYYVPDSERFKQVMDSAGIPEDKTIIIYDSANIVRAARIWWTMKVYEYNDIRLLNGGFKAWIKAGYDSTNNRKTLPITDYKPGDFNKDICVDRDYVKNKIGKSGVIFIDCRSKKEFQEGHIPGAINIEYINNLNDNGWLKSAEYLSDLYEDNNVIYNKEIILYCGCGSRSALTFFVLKGLLGYPKVANYNGGWMEYSSLDSLKSK